MQRRANLLRNASATSKPYHLSSARCARASPSFPHQVARLSHGRLSSYAFYSAGAAFSSQSEAMSTVGCDTRINDMGLAFRKLAIRSTMQPCITSSDLKHVYLTSCTEIFKHHFRCMSISTSTPLGSPLASDIVKTRFFSSTKHAKLDDYRNVRGLTAFLHKTPSSRRILRPECGHRRGVIHVLIRTHVGHAHSHHEHNQDDTGEAGERVSRLGLIADVFLTVGKGFAGYVSGSTAVIADAAHSMSDVVLSAVALWIFKAARAPKDQMHPYGHGKFETVGALGISSMLLLTGGGIAWHAFESLQGLLSATDASTVVSTVQSGAEHANSFSHDHAHGGHLVFDREHSTLALSATLVSIGVKEGLFWATKRVGDARGSELLKANAWHHRSDAISSVIALLGVGGAMLGWQFLDPLAGLLVSGLIVKAGLQTGYKSLQELVDSALPESVLSTFRETVMSVKGLKGCHALRGRKAGSSLHLDVHIEVDPWLSVSAAHMIGEAVRQKLREKHSALEDVFIHIDPADAFTPSTPLHNPTEGPKGNGDDPYQQQEVENVVRGLVQSDFGQVMAFERIRCHFLQGKLLVELEVSMQPMLSIRDAMLHARKAEELIMKACPKISAVETQLRLTRYS